MSIDYLEGGEKKREREREGKGGEWKKKEKKREKREGKGRQEENEIKISALSKKLFFALAAVFFGGKLFFFLSSSFLEGNLSRKRYLIEEPDKLASRYVSFISLVLRQCLRKRRTAAAIFENWFGDCFEGKTNSESLIQTSLFLPRQIKFHERGLWSLLIFER